MLPDFWEIIYSIKNAGVCVLMMVCQEHSVTFATLYQSNTLAPWRGESQQVRGALHQKSASDGWSKDRDKKEEITGELN